MLYSTCITTADPSLQMKYGSILREPSHTKSMPFSWQCFPTDSKLQATSTTIGEKLKPSSSKWMSRHALSAHTTPPMPLKPKGELRDVVRIRLLIVSRKEAMSSEAPRVD